jgi:two-component system, response regulator PdtaR
MPHSDFAYSPVVAASSDRSNDERITREQQETNKENGKGRIILIVEDDFLIAMQAEIALMDAGFTVSGIAATAEEALAFAKRCQPTLVVMDVRLAGQRDGIDAARDLFYELGLRCVFATAHDDLQTRVRAEPFAPLGWLAKPYTMPSLVKLVREAISKQN